MSVYRQSEKQYSLKDILFNLDKVRQLSMEIKAVYPEFKSKAFVNETVRAFKDQELMERVRHIRDMLRKYLPKDYEMAVSVICESLPPELDNNKEDNDFGDFIYAPYSYFVATYGCNKKDVTLSLKALSQITKRFSAEASLRDFLNSFPEETLRYLDEWSQSQHYHLRRLVSEGTRPNLPWAKKINLPHSTFLSLLDRLHSDPTRYVVRSVANHLNDISKVDKKTVFTLLRKWRKEKQQSEEELNYIVKHSLRTLIKQGDKTALKFVGVKTAEVEVGPLRLKSKTIYIGDSLDFSFSIKSTNSKPQLVMVDYVIHFKKANGSLAPKTFKLTKNKLAPGETIRISKQHQLKKMSTRTLYAGEHKLSVQVNGLMSAIISFNLA